MTPSPTAPLVDHRQGILIASIGVVVLSFDALLVRLAATSATDIAFWRGAFIFLSMTLFILATGRAAQFRRYAAHGLAAVVITVMYGINTGLFVFSVSHTSAANTVVILASSAFFAAFFSWLLLRETIPLRTWVAILVALGGVVTVFAEPFSLGPVNYGWLAVMGLVQMPIASVMLMMATRYLPSPEVSLFLLIETVLGPIWVWIVLAEAIPPLTAVGGTAIMGAIFVHSWLALKRSPTRVDTPTEPPL